MEVVRLREQSAGWRDDAHLERHAVEVHQGAGLAVRVDTPSGQSFAIDEPAWFGGEDGGPNPAEALLGALAASFGVTVRVYAALLGVEVERIVTKATGALDLRGFLDPESEHRSGFAALRLDVELTLPADAPDADMDALVRAATAACPLLDTLRDPPPFELSVVRQPPDASISPRM